MTISADAALLIGGYKTESKQLIAILKGRDESFTVSMTVTVSDFVEGSRLRLEASDGSCCKVDLRGCQFRYGDMREVPESDREGLSDIVGVLVIEFPSGDWLSLAEISPED